MIFRNHLLRVSGGISATNAGPCLVGHMRVNGLLGTECGFAVIEWTARLQLTGGESSDAA